MSKIKNMLPDDYETPYETLEPESVLDDEYPDVITWKIVEIDNALDYIEKLNAYDRLDELVNISNKLQQLIDKLKTPF